MPTLEERVTRAEQIISNLLSRLNAAEIALAQAKRIADNAAADSVYNQQSIKRMRRRLRG